MSALFIGTELNLPKPVFTPYTMSPLLKTVFNASFDVLISFFVF